jgi:triosephosphate isomerase
LIVAGNFKTFKGREESGEYLDRLESLVSDSESEVVVFPPITALQSHSGKVAVGSQNGYPAENGAFTGEIGLEQLREFSIETILIGHSERREILNESDDFISEKFQFFSEQNFQIVLCIGESLETRKKGKREVMEFLKGQLSKIDLSYKNFVIAYEPIWAIGTGITPTNSEIEHALRNLAEFSGKEILYGGSVKLENVEEILSLPSCSGVLVGGASLNADNFGKMVKIADKVEK